LLFILALVALVSALSLAYVYATTVVGAIAGNAGDSNPTTFKFQTDNSDKPLTWPNMAPIARSEVATVYGTSQP